MKELKEDTPNLSEKERNRIHLKNLRLFNYVQQKAYQRAIADFTYRNERDLRYKRLKKSTNWSTHNNSVVPSKRRTIKVTIEKEVGHYHNSWINKDSITYVLDIPMKIDFKSGSYVTIDKFSSPVDYFNSAFTWSWKNAGMKFRYRVPTDSNKWLNEYCKQEYEYINPNRTIPSKEKKLKKSFLRHYIVILNADKEQYSLFPKIRMMYVSFYKNTIPSVTDFSIAIKMAKTVIDKNFIGYHVHNAIPIVSLYEYRKEIGFKIPILRYTDFINNSKNSQSSISNKSETRLVTLIHPETRDIVRVSKKEAENTLLTLGYKYCPKKVFKASNVEEHKKLSAGAKPTEEQQRSNIEAELNRIASKHKGLNRFKTVGRKKVSKSSSLKRHVKQNKKHKNGRNSKG